MKNVRLCRAKSRLNQLSPCSGLERRRCGACRSPGRHLRSLRPEARLSIWTSSVQPYQARHVCEEDWVAAGVSSQFLELSLKQLLTDMMRLKEVIVNRRLHDGRTAAAVPPERGV